MTYLIEIEVDYDSGKSPRKPVAKKSSAKRIQKKTKAKSKKVVKKKKK